LTVMLLLTSGVAVFLTCALFFAHEFLTFRRTTVAQLSTLGEVIANNCTAALAFNSAEDAQQILSALKADRHIVAAGLYSEANVLIARYPANLADGLLPKVPHANGYVFEPNGLALFQSVIQDRKRLGTLYLYSNLDAMYERLRLYSGMILLVAATSFSLAFLLSRVLQKQISRPILALAETAKAISDRQDYSVRAVKLGNDEVGRLTDAFNQMLGQLDLLNRELEQRVLKRTTELEAANHELEAFSYSVSHDLRAPLRHIGGFAAMLQTHAQSLLDEKGRRYVSVIQESAKRMGQLIDDLLLFSRNGRTELRRTAVNLNELVEQIRQSLTSDLTGRTVTWEIATLPMVSGDLALLRQVFTNLLSNAVKYTRRREDARIQIGLQSGPSTEAIVFVRDNGAGFDMRYADKLFGVFQRLHEDREFEGTGVGLATVRRIVLRHGGRVWAEAKVQAGATFFVALPATNGVPPDPPPFLS
jgi:signal transduction histidine kinase